MTSRSFIHSFIFV